MNSLAANCAGVVDLASGIATLGLSLSAAQRDRLAAYLALLAKWNKTYNLTAIRDPQRMVTHHLLDALAVMAHLPAHPGLRILDVGSGGGVPGIPLAIALPDARVVLVDSNHKKATFLVQAAIELGLTNVEAHALRIEDYTPDVPFDVVISRAFSDLTAFAVASTRHLTPHGQLFAMKGVHPDEEIALLPPEFVVRAAPALRVPGLDAARHLIILQPKHASEKTQR